MSGEHKFIDGLMQGNVVVNGTVTASGANAAKIKAMTALGTLTAADSGKLITLGTAGGFTVTLPKPAAGLEYTFVVKVAPTTAYIILTDSVANIIQGGASSPEDAQGSVSCAAASDTITFVANKAVIGDRISLISDGTYWYCTGLCAVQDGITLTQAG